MGRHSCFIKGFVALLASATLLAGVMGGCGKGIINEQAAMLLEQRLGQTTVTVYPVYVRDGEEHRYDADQALALATYVREQDLATPTVVSAEVPLTTEWGMNQAKMLRHSAGDFGQFVRENKIDTEYALLAEYLFGGRGRVQGVHLYVVDQEGTVAYAILANSHHQAFKAVDPQDVADCTEIVRRIIADDMDSSGGPKSADTAKARGTVGSLTIYPIVLAGNASKDFSDVVGLMLEREGFDNVLTTDAVVTPAEPDADLAADFAKQVAEADLKTDYALYANVLASRETGVENMRMVIADRAGRVIWHEDYQPSKGEVKRAGGCQPMGMCALIKQRIKPLLDRHAPRLEWIPAGHMEQLWAEKSGTPSDAEEDAIDARLAKLRSAAPGVTVAIYPPRVGSDESAPEAAKLAEQIKSAGVFNAAVVDALPGFEVAGNSNEQRVLWDLARAFQKYLKEHPPTADYALYTHYIMRPNDGKVFGVHIVICDRAGDWVFVDFQNDHHPDFKRINPHSVADCHELVIKRLRRGLR